MPRLLSAHTPTRSVDTLHSRWRRRHSRPRSLASAVNDLRQHTNPKSQYGRLAHAQERGHESMVSVECQASSVRCQSSAEKSRQRARRLTLDATQSNTRARSKKQEASFEPNKILWLPRRLDSTRLQTLTDGAPDTHGRTDRHSNKRHHAGLTRFNWAWLFVCLYALLRGLCSACLALLTILTSSGLLASLTSIGIMSTCNRASSVWWQSPHHNMELS